MVLTSVEDLKLSEIELLPTVADMPYVLGRIVECVARANLLEDYPAQMENIRGLVAFELNELALNNPLREDGKLVSTKEAKKRPKLKVK